MVYLILVSGMYILYSKYLGERNTAQKNKVFATSFISMVISIIAISAITLLFGDKIFPLLCPEESILPEFSQYAILSATATYAMNGFSVFFSSILSLEGKPMISIYSMAITIVVCFICDFVFMEICHFGIKSIALSMAIAFFYSTLFQIRYIIKDYKHLFSNLLPNFSFKAMKDNALQALPEISYSVCILIAVTFLNLYIQKTSGADGLFAWSAFSNVMGLSLCVIDAICLSCLTLGLFYKGQNDYKGLNYIIKKSVITIVLLGALTIGLMVFFPGLIVGFFGADSPEILEYSKTCIRFCATIAPGLILIYFGSSFFQLNGNLFLSTITLTFYPIGVIVASLFVDNSANSWMLFPICGAIIVLLMLFSFYLAKRKKNSVVEQTQHAFDISIKADKESFKGSLQELSDYLKNLGLDHLLVFRINVCIEEVIINIVDNSGANMTNHTFDVHIAMLDKKIVCSIKDDNKAFNPIHLPEDQRKMGLQILFGLCQNIDYKYMYGQNMTYLSWEKE